MEKINAPRATSAGAGGFNRHRLNAQMRFSPQGRKSSGGRFMRVFRSARWVLPALLLSLVPVMLGAQNSTANSDGSKNKSAQDHWDARPQAAPQPHGSGSGAGTVHKNISDGAAKGQATDGAFKPHDTSSPSKNGADGAAKGQATEGVYYKPHDSTSPSKNISDGAAKGQADELTAPYHNNNLQGKGQAGQGAMKSKSAQDDWNAPTSTAAPPKSGGKSARDDWSAQAKTAQKPSAGNAKGKTAPKPSGSSKNKSAQDAWDSPK
jgi:hypothetical protein